MLLAHFLLGVCLIIYILQGLYTLSRPERLLEKIGAFVRYNEFWRVALTLNFIKLVDYTQLFDLEQKTELKKQEALYYEKINKKKRAIVDLAIFMSMEYDFKNWPQDMYRKWEELYKNHKPIKITEFYSSETKELYPEVAKFFEHVVGKGLKPPEGFVQSKEDVVREECLV